MDVHAVLLLLHPADMHSARGCSTLLSMYCMHPMRRALSTACRYLHAARVGAVRGPAPERRTQYALDCMCTCGHR